MPPVDLQVQTNQDENPEETMSSKPIIGIIYPPPEVRNIVDKTASFVARNGPEFENRIRSNEINNPKFNFLTPNDPYHAYYQHKVKEFKEGKGQEPAAPKPGIPLGLAQKTILEQVKIIEPIVPKEPPPEFEFIADPPSISAFDLDIVRLTAQFVARNGRQFLTNLMNRENRNYQFDFLRPQHSLFNYFTKLVEQYTKILIPPKDLLGKLRKEADDPKLILEQVKYRVEWIRFQEREKQKEEAAQEKERVAYAQIDWHDFVVVETVDFQQNETGNLPPPTTPEEVGARMLRQERIDKGEGAMEMDSDEEEEEEEEEEEKTKAKEKEKAPAQEVKKQSKPEPAPPVPKEKPIENKDVKHMELDMEEDSEPSDESDESDEEKEKEPPPPQPEDMLPPALPPLPPPPPSEIPQPPLPPTPGQVLIKKDYNPKSRTVTPQEAAASGDSLMVSPITGEKIPAHKVKEHMRIGLLDPKWIEQRNRAMEEKKEQEDVYAPGTSIEKSLKQLAERRTDIFGIGVEETQIGKKIGEEEKKERKIVWDGHTASMEKVTQKARENISIEQQIAVIHKVKGLIPDEEKEKIGPAAPKPPTSKPPSTKPSMPLPPPPPPKTVPPPPPVSMPIKPPAPPPPKTAHNTGVKPLIQPPNVMVLPRPPPPMQRPILGHPPRMPIPAPPRGFQPPVGMRPPPPPMSIPKLMPDKSEDEPPTKRAKTEESLIPEEEFLARNRGPVTFKVAVPHLPDKAEWNLGGQMLTFTLPLTDAVSVIKAKLNEALGMPAGKQKLQFEGMFIKDSNTLAFYNFTPRSLVNLQLKERGGRKK